MPHGLTDQRFSFPKQHLLERAMKRLTYAEKVVLGVLIAVFAFSSLSLLYRLNKLVLVDVPLRGGRLTEGVVGNPRFINPVLAISEADKNLVSLVYSGLVKTDENGILQMDLAKEIDVSEDRLTYTVKLNPLARFQDGEPLTADDVIFTVNKVQNPNLKSPQYGNFTGVTVNKVDDETVTFTLKKPYVPFLSNLRLGIIPKYIWNSVSDDEFAFSQWNITPIGTGPYKISKVTRDSGGIPNFYELVPFDKYLGQAPYIANYDFKFFHSMPELLGAFRAGDIESLAGISPDEAVDLKNDGAAIQASPLPRVFGVFFNQSANPVLLDKAVRTALNLTAPKAEIVSEVLKGYGSAIDGPFPAGSLISDNATTTSRALRLELASSTLAKAGWVKNPNTGILEKKSKKDTLRLSFTLSTSDNPELEAVGKILKQAWEDMGAQVELAEFPAGDLNQNVLRPRRYEALLFGEVVGRDLDVYPFWDSSERNDPGLNIALYTNSKADSLLTDARSESDLKKRLALYENFDKIVHDDVPAVFLYSPDFLAVYPSSVQGLALSNLEVPQDRFLGISDWYIETNPVWTVFAKDKTLTN